MTDFYDSTPAEQAERLTQLATSALTAWQLEGAAVALIKHRENAVFRVTSGDQDYALRVHRAGYHSDAELRSELAWVRAIDSAALRTPQVIPTAAGELFAHVECDAVPESRQVDLLEWFDGAPLADIESPMSIDELARTFESVGRLMATTHNHSSSWPIPEDFERHAWDEAGILGDHAFWGNYADLAALTDAQIELLDRAKVKALGALDDFGKAEDRYGLIHADFLPENLLRNGDEICLIDFDDAGFGWHLFDIATTLFFHLGEPHFDEALASLVAGYRSQRDLPDSHLAQLPLFFLLRGYTYLGWAHTRRETETAQGMTPVVVSAVVEMAGDYLS